MISLGKSGQGQKSSLGMQMRKEAEEKQRGLEEHLEMEGATELVT